MLFWVCYHPDIPNRFAIRVEGYGEMLWIFEDSFNDVDDLSNVVPLGNTPRSPDAVPKVFKSWTTAVKFLIEQGEDHICICLHNDHSPMVPGTVH